MNNTNKLLLGLVLLEKVDKSCHTVTETYPMKGKEIGTVTVYVGSNGSPSPTRDQYKALRAWGWCEDTEGIFMWDSSRTEETETCQHCKGLGGSCSYYPEDPCPECGLTCFEE